MWLLVVLGGQLGCSHALPRPATGEHPNTEPRLMANAKPSEPVQVDHVDSRPSETAVWVDGFWDWKGHRWVWVPGSWQEAPGDSYYAPPQLVHWPTPLYGEGGKQVGFTIVYLYLPGHWHRRDGQVVEAQKKR